MNLKRLLRLSAFIAVLMIFAVSPCAGAEQKMRLAVMNVTDDSKLLKQADMIANNFIRVMAKSEAFSVVEREELELMKIKQKINDSQLHEIRTATKLATIMSCQYFVLSSLVYNDIPIVGIRVVNSSTSEIIFAGNEFVDEARHTSIMDASSRLAYKFLEQLTGAKAIITDIEGSEITINRGSLSGVTKGSLYLVYSGTEKKYDDVAIIRVKDVRTSFSYAEIVRNAGKISVLRKSDTITPISKEQADTIIKRKKFLSSRPASDLVAENKNQQKISWRGYEDCLKYAEQGNAEAQYNIGLMYINGWEVKQDFAKAVEWYRKAAEQGYAAGQFTLGAMYQYGLGVKQDYKKAVELYRKAAEQGNDAGQNNLGYMYWQGLGVKQDYKKAVELFRKAAEQGNDAGQNNLGYMYMKGLGVKQDYKKAVELFRKAAEQGYALGQNSLGYMYMKGLGVKQDYKKAVELIQKAAEQGNTTGQYNLGYMYEKGLGVKQSRAKAIKWYRKAAAQGDEDAKKRLKELGAE